MTVCFLVPKIKFSNLQLSSRRRGYLKERSVRLQFRQSIVGRQNIVLQGTEIRIIINNGREE